MPVGVSRALGWHLRIPITMAGTSGGDATVALPSVPCGIDTENHRTAGAGAGDVGTGRFPAPVTQQEGRGLPGDNRCPVKCVGVPGTAKFAEARDSTTSMSLQAEIGNWRLGRGADLRTGAAPAKVLYGWRTAEFRHWRFSANVRPGPTGVLRYRPRSGMRQISAAELWRRDHHLDSSLRGRLGNFQPRPMSGTLYVPVRSRHQLTAARDPASTRHRRMKCHGRASAQPG